MKAVILAAGKGERLRGVVDNIPKPMIGYNGKPILQHNVELCRDFGIRELFINTHHLPEVIRSHFGDGSVFGVSIRYSFEEHLLGTAGALNNFRENLGKEEFFVLYGDNLSNFDLSSLVKEFQRHECIGVIAFHHREDVTQSGVGEFGPDRRILRFVEKPKPDTTDSHWVNAGVYYFASSIFEYIPPAGFSDFGKDIFPALLQKGIALYGVCANVELKAFDTPELMRSALGETRGS